VRARTVPPMAVTVVTARDGTGAPYAREVYAQANDFTVVTPSGVLLVEIRNTETLGVYAPGTWSSAHRDDSVAVNVGG
jgi:hypothetical protein